MTSTTTQLCLVTLPSRPGNYPNQIVFGVVWKAEWFKCILLKTFSLSHFLQIIAQGAVLSSYSTRGYCLKDPVPVKTIIGQIWKSDGKTHFSHVFFGMEALKVHNLYKC